VGKSDGGRTWCTAGGGMWLGNAHIFISKCLIRNNRLTGSAAYYGAGIFFGNYWFPSTFKANISYCDISRNHSGGVPGVWVSNVDSTTFTNCTFFNKDTGSAVVVDGSEHLRLANCIIASNFLGIVVSRVSQCDISYNNVFDSPCANMPEGFGVLDTVNHNGDSCDCYYNIFLDPMFLDTANTDLHLLAGSPCIDAGDPASPYDPDSTIADLGCYYYTQTGVEVNPVVRHFRKYDYPGPTIFHGPLVLPKGRTGKVFDITGCEVKPHLLQPGVYFIEIDGQIVQKVIKIK
jgi:parallel beta-helix repeat protein